MENLQGTLLKGYKLEERIGNGGFGAVYRAKQSTIGREVAVKIILPGYANNPDFIRRFESEAHLIARLEHPHITPLHDFWRDPDGAYLVMRYLKGGSVRDALQNSPYELNATSQLLDQVASALDFAHRNDVIHRDIKPGNILLDEDGNAYLADFGIAKDLTGIADNKTAADAVVGSLDYISPEQARSEPVTPRTDIYSLGVTLYEMITGEHPFQNTSAVERLYKHINDPLPEISNLPDTVCEAVNDIISIATAKNPEDRYPDVLALAAAFREGIGRGILQQAANVVEQLTIREQEVLLLIAKNMSNREIADELVVTMGTVKWHITQLYKKLGVRSRVQAIVRARELNLIVSGDTTSDLPFKSDQPVSISLPEPENPYKGLHAFQMTDSRDFFGRDDLTQKLIDHMNNDDPYHRFLAIIGPSGCGKSSLVKAGLIPALWKGAIAGSEKWFVVDMIPGSRPLDKLEIALMRVSANQSQNLRQQLERDDHGLSRVADLILPGNDTELVIVVDQFEEVFTLVDEEDARQHFLDLLRVAVSDVRSRIRVVLTMRADYYDRPLHYPEFGELIRNRMETVLPLTAKGLERAVRGPAERVGVTFEQGLVEQIVSQMNYQAGALPLLQYALTELFDRRKGRILTNNAYQQIGGAVGALANRADEVNRSLTEYGQELAHQMFMRLVTLGEGAEDTRRRATHAELLSLTDNTDLMEEIIDQFAAYRLLSLDHDPETRQPTVEVAHEAILREWDRLRQWLNESRDDIRQERAVSRAADEWNQHQRDISFLLRGTRLEQVEKWLETSNLIQTPLEQEFIAQSLQYRQKEQQTELARQERENRLEQRSQSFLRGLVAVFALATMIAGGFGLIALNSRNAEAEARQDAEIAEFEALRQASIGLAALAMDSVQNSSDRETGVLLALETVEHYPHTPQAVGTLALAVDQYREHRYFFTTGIINSSASVATWSPDGTRLASGGRGSTNSDSVAIWDVAAGEITVSTPMFGEACQEAQFWPYDLVWSPDGTKLAGIAKTRESGFGCGIVVIDSTSAATLLTIDDPGSPARSLDWSQDGIMFVTGHEDGTIRLWDVDSGTAISILTGHEGITHDARFSPDNTRIVSASGDGSVRLWDIATGDELMTMWGHAGSVNSVWWSPDGLQIVSGGFDALPRVWDVDTGQVLYVMAGHTSPVVSVYWSDDGSRISTHSLDATAKVWDVDTGRLFMEINNVPPSDFTKLGYAELDPTGQWLVTGGGLITGVELWDTASPIPVLFGHSFGQEWGGWSPDGTVIATAGSDGSTRIWDAATGEQIRDLEDGSFHGSWSPDSARLVTPMGVEAFELAIWDIESGEVLARMAPDDDGLGALSLGYTEWSPDGNHILSIAGRAGIPPQMLIWDANTYEQLATISLDYGCGVGWPKWSPDSTQIVGGCWGGAPGEETYARIWDAQTGDILMQLENPAEGSTWYTEWSPDGTKLLTTHGGGIIVIWDVASGEPILTFTEHYGRGAIASWSPDGTLIASSGFSDRNLKIWDANTGEASLSTPIPVSPYNIAWSPDGSQIMLSGDGLIEPLIMRVWRSTDDLVAHAYECCVSRELSPEERTQYGLPERNE